MPGIRADDVDPPELVESRLDRPLHLLEGAHVGDGLDCTPAGRLDLPDRLVKILFGRERVGKRLERLGTYVHRDYVRALVCEAHRVRPTLPTASAANQCHFPIYNTHIVSFSH